MSVLEAHRHGLALSCVRIAHEEQSYLKRALVQIDDGLQEILNTEQGARFTSEAFTSTIESCQIQDRKNSTNIPVAPINLQKSQ